MSSVEILSKYGLPSSYINLLKERGIVYLNPLQVKAIESGVLDEKNALIVAPTASGKTLIGEMALVKNCFNGFKSIYLVPLRALASEIYDDFQILSNIGLKIGITTGDYESPAEYLGKYDLIMATYERFDSLLRLKPSWLKNVKCVVIDEFHNINDPDRGPIIEMIIARLLNNNVKVIGLSATIGNPHVLAKWMDAVLVDYAWRPVELIEGYFDKNSHSIIYIDRNRIEKINYRVGSPLLDIVLQSYLEDIQLLVFVHNRRKAEEYAEEFVEKLGLFKHLIKHSNVDKLLTMLNESPSRIERDRLSRLIKYGVAYHHAGLSSIARKTIENGFRDRLIKVVFATPTLAAGVNLPARRVLVSIKRYDPVYSRTRNIPVFEYKQMAGRAGRPRYDSIGESVIYDASDYREALSYIKGLIEPVTSKLSNLRSLRIHVLSLIASGDASDFDEILNVFKKTLYYVLTSDLGFITNSIEDVINQLILWRMITYSDGKYFVTELGRVTSFTYLDPLTVHKYLNNIVNKPSTLYYLHKITNNPDYMKSRVYISDRIVSEYENEAIYRAKRGEIPSIPDEEYEYYEWLLSFVHALILYEWINEVDEDSIIRKYNIGPGDLYTMRDTAAWIAGSLSRVERIFKTSRSVDLEKLSIRLEYGIKEDAIELIKIEGIGRVRARILIEHGIDSLEKLAKTPSSFLETLPSFGPVVVKRIKEQLREMGYI